MTALLAATFLLMQLLCQVFATEGSGCEPPSGYVKFPQYNAAYKIHPEYVPWSYARDRCVSEGGHLAVFTSAEKLEHIVNRTIYGSIFFMYTGIRQSASHDCVKFDNGSVSDENHNCAVVWTREGVRAISIDSYTVLAFVCETSTDEGCPSPVGPQGTDKGIEVWTGDAGAPSGYVEFPKYNASYKLHEDNVPWDYARDRCIAEGAHLAVFTSVEKLSDIINSENPIILVNVSAEFLLSVTSIHTGIYRPAATGDWIRLDNGLPATSIQWSARFNPDRDDNCAVILDGDSFEITNGDCNQNFPFICEKSTAEGSPGPVGPQDS